MSKARFALVLVVPALALGACGGGDDVSSDEESITSIVEQIGTDPVAVCEHLSADGLRALGGKEECERAGEASGDRGSETSIEDLEIDGGDATATIKDDDGSTKVTFVKEDGDWKVVG